MPNPTPPTPIYTADNCTFTGPLRWGLTVFWRTPIADSAWLGDLRQALEVDGIRLLSHRLKDGRISQFALSTLAGIAPMFIVNRVKGRLQHLVRQARPKAFQRNYALRSFGPATRAAVERYVAEQVTHHPPADERVEALLQRFQIFHPEVDLSRPRPTAHAIYWYNLHVVVVHLERWRDIHEEMLERVRNTIEGVCRSKKFALVAGRDLTGPRASGCIWRLGCPLEMPPAEVALVFLNNLAYAHGMKAVYQFGAYAGTFGEYHQGAVKSDEDWTGDEEGMSGEEGGFRP